MIWGNSPIVIPAPLGCAKNEDCETAARKALPRSSVRSSGREILVTNIRTSRRHDNSHNGTLSLTL